MRNLKQSRCIKQKSKRVVFICVIVPGPMTPIQSLAFSKDGEDITFIEIFEISEMPWKGRSLIEIAISIRDCFGSRSQLIQITQMHGSQSLIEIAISIRDCPFQGISNISNLSNISNISNACI